MVCLQKVEIKGKNQTCSSYEKQEQGRQQQQGQRQEQEQQQGRQQQGRQAKVGEAV